MSPYHEKDLIAHRLAYAGLKYIRRGKLPGLMPGVATLQVLPNLCYAPVETV